MTLLSRFGEALKSFFFEVKKSFCFQPLTPVGRLEFFVHSTILGFLSLACLYLLFLNTHISTMWNYILIAFASICCLVPLGRFFLNRALDLTMHFNDEKKLFFSPKTMLSLIVISITAIATLILVYPKITSYFVLTLFLTLFFLAILILQSIFFPSKTLNLFENISFSSKTKEFIFFALCGVLQLLALFCLVRIKIYYGNVWLSFNLAPHICFITIFYCSIFYLIIFGKNTFARLLLSLILFCSIFAFFDSGILKSLLYFIPLALVFLSCRKNFILCIIPILGLKLSPDQGEVFVFLFCLYLALIIDFFEFKEPNDLVYSSLWAMCISAVYFYIAPMLHISLPFWLQDSLPLPLLFIIFSGFLVGIIYLNCQIKNYPKIQLAVIMYLGIMLTFFRHLPYLIKDCGLPFDFLPIVFVLLFWIISNDENLSSAYKLAICSTLLILQIFPAKDFELSLMGNILLFKTICVLFLAYLFYKIKSPFRMIIYTSALLCITSTIFAFIVDANLTQVLSQFGVKITLQDVYPAKIVVSHFLLSMLFCFVCCYIFYKQKDSFKADLTLK